MVLSPPYRGAQDKKCIGNGDLRDNNAEFVALGSRKGALAVDYWPFKRLHLTRCDP